MTVIRDEYISDDITMHDVLPIGFLKKSRYTGEKKNMRFLLEKYERLVAADMSDISGEKAGTAKEGGSAAGSGDKASEAEARETETVLRACVWRGPFAYDHTDDSLKENEYFAFSTEGIEKAVEWLNTKLGDYS